MDILTQSWGLSKKASILPCASFRSHPSCAIYFSTYIITLGAMNVCFSLWWAQNRKESSLTYSLIACFRIKDTWKTVGKAMSEVYIHQDEQVTTKKASYLQWFRTCTIQWTNRTVRGAIHFHRIVCKPFARWFVKFWSHRKAGLSSLGIALLDRCKSGAWYNQQQSCWSSD